MTTTPYLGKTNFNIMDSRECHNCLIREMACAFWIIGLHKLEHQIICNSEETTSSQVGIMCLDIRSEWSREQAQFIQLAVGT